MPNVITSPASPRAKRLHAATAATLAALFSLPATAFDARGIALGGSTVANGSGVNGVIDNPASLLAAQRRQDSAHFTFGGALDGRDHADLLSLARDADNRDLPNDLDNAIDALTNATVSAECSGINLATAPDSTVCLTDTVTVAELTDDAVEILDDLNGEVIEALGQGQLGVAVTRTRFPFALHITARATGSGSSNIAQQDRNFANNIIDVLEDNELTLGEIRANADIDLAGQSVSIERPGDVLMSTGDGTGMIRTQFGLSVGTSIEIAGTALDIGVTSKFSRLRAFGIEAELSDAFDDTSESFRNQFQDSEETETSVTFDIGASAELETLPIRVSAVLLNVIPESIDTDTGFEFETTPQLLAGVVHQRDSLSLMATVALNSADLDGIKTQPLALGLEFGGGLFALRGGISIDLGRLDDEVALSAGVKLGPVEIGGRLSGINRGQIGAQLAFGF